MRYILSTLLTLSLFSNVSAQINPELDDTLSNAHHAVEKELAEFALTQGYNIATNATVVDADDNGFAAMAGLQEDVLNIDLVAGTDVAAIYYSPNSALPSAFPGGFYLARLRYNANGETELAYVDRAGKTAHTQPVDLSLKPVAPNYPPETAGYRINVTQGGTGIVALAPSLHGHCWIVDVGHGSCWLYPIERLAAAN